MTINILLLFWLCLLTKHAKGDTAEVARNCSSVLLEGPYKGYYRDVVGAVYDLANKTHNERPVFSLGGKYFLYSNTRHWIIGSQVGSGSPKILITSNASHPVDASGPWMILVEDSGDVRGYPLYGVSARCYKGPPAQNSTCRSVVLSGPYIHLHREIIGAVFYSTDIVVSGRPVFKAPCEFDRYLFYNSKRTEWIVYGAYNIANKKPYFAVPSDAYHPADVRGVWADLYSENESRPGIQINCSDTPEFPSTCSAVRMFNTSSGPGRNDRIFNQTGIMHYNRPIFKDSESVKFLSYNNDTKRWIIARVLNRYRPDMFVNSIAVHPVDVRGIWIVSRNGSYKTKTELCIECIPGTDQPSTAPANTTTGDPTTTTAVSTLEYTLQTTGFSSLHSTSRSASTVSVTKCQLPQPLRSGNKFKMSSLTYIASLEVKTSNTAQLAIGGNNDGTFICDGSGPSRNGPGMEYWGRFEVSPYPGTLGTCFRITPIARFPTVVGFNMRTKMFHLDSYTVPAIQLSNGTVSVTQEEACNSGDIRADREGALLDFSEGNIQPPNCPIEFQRSFSSYSINGVSCGQSTVVGMGSSLVINTTACLLSATFFPEEFREGLQCIHDFRIRGQHYLILGSGTSTPMTYYCSPTISF